MDYLEEVDYRDPEFGDFYDELPLWSAPFGLRLLDRVRMQTGSTILDIGAGTGFLSVELAQRCGAQTHLIAVEPWSAAAIRLRKKVERLGLGNVEILEQPAEDLQLPDDSVDVIVSNLGINNFENVDSVLRVLFRAAKRGAQLLLATNLEGHMAEFYEVFRETLIQGGQSDRVAGLDEHVRDRGTVDSVAGTLRKAGFAVARAETDVFTIRFADGASMLRHHFIRLGFMQSWKSLVAPDRLDETFQALERNLDSVATQNGELALTVPMALIEASK